MQNVEKALEGITDIRNQIALGRMFRGFGPAVIALTGLFALMLTAAQLIWPQKLAASDIALLGWWMFAAVLSVIIIGIEMFALSRRYHGGLAGSMISNAVQTFLPIGAAGAVIGLIILMNKPSLAWLLPGLWQILIAIGIFSSLKFLPKAIAITGAWYFLAGSIVLLLGSHNVPLSPLAMGVPFAIGQGVMALILFKTLEVSRDGR
ncbi:hypothetical protein N9M10_02355 [Hellea sp.]|nr:hypothetical protein [Hellea sp.]